MIKSAIFRFDPIRHEYIEPGTGYVFPHTTGMLEASGWIDDRWYTEESSARGHAVHRLTAEYDLGALDLPSVVDGRRGYLLAHAKALAILRPAIVSVEEPLVHPDYRYGTRPDRVVEIDGLLGVLELKSGGVEKSHAIQTALQAIAVAPGSHLARRPQDVARWALYIKGNGKFKLVEHKDRADFDEAFRIIHKYAVGRLRREA
jgi:hypothetical protein